MLQYVATYFNVLQRGNSYPKMTATQPTVLSKHWKLVEHGNYDSRMTPGRVKVIDALSIRTTYHPSGTVSYLIPMPNNPDPSFSVDSHCTVTKQWERYCSVPHMYLHADSVDTTIADVTKMTALFEKTGNPQNGMALFMVSAEDNISATVHFGDHAPLQVILPKTGEVKFVYRT